MAVIVEPRVNTPPKGSIPWGCRRSPSRSACSPAFRHRRPGSPSAPGPSHSSRTHGSLPSCRGTPEPPAPSSPAHNDVYTRASYSLQCDDNKYKLMTTFSIRSNIIHLTPFTTSYQRKLIIVTVFALDLIILNLHTVMILEILLIACSFRLPISHFLNSYFVLFLLLLFTDWLTDWLIDWLIYWLVDWLFYGRFRFS